jgi:hypothetical protein
MQAPAAGVKEHELPTQRPVGWGQRRRSSIMERLTRESTKDGIVNYDGTDFRTKYDSLYSVKLGVIVYCYRNCVREFRWLFMAC